jgi:UDP-N-acetylmuramoyl-tripeptide--D-alanyl-D-alanine ligase
MACTGGRLTGALADDALRIVGVSTDTRSVRPGEVFVALRGDSFDGHDHLAAAADKGAVLAIVERPVEPPAGLTLLIVPSSLDALGALASCHLSRWRAAGSRRVLALTGSAGKTTTRIAIASLLEALRPGEVHCAAGNLNNLIGVPMVVLGLEDAHRYAVLELGTNAPGEIGKLARMLRPDVGLVTLIAAAHTEGLGGIDGVAREKSALFDALTGSESVAMGNADDPRVAAAVMRSDAARRITYGESEDASYRILARELLDAAVQGRHGQQQLRIRADRDIEVETPLVGATGALATCAAVAAVEVLLAEPLDGSMVGASLAAAGGRMRPMQTSAGALVIDDSYNANPASCRASIAAAREMARAEGRPLVLVLGEMRELGTLAVSEHEALGDVVAESGARLLIAVGGDASHIAERAQRHAVAARFVATSEEAAELARDEVSASDVVLVKGSRGVHTERVVEALLASFDASSNGTAPHDRCSAGGAA